LKKNDVRFAALSFRSAVFPFERIGTISTLRQKNQDFGKRGHQ